MGYCGRIGRNIGGPSATLYVDFFEQDRSIPVSFGFPSRSCRALVRLICEHHLRYLTLPYGTAYSEKPKAYRLD